MGEPAGFSGGFAALVAALRTCGLTPYQVRLETVALLRAALALGDRERAELLLTVSALAEADAGVLRLFAVLFRHHPKLELLGLARIPVLAAPAGLPQMAPAHPFGAAAPVQVPSASGPGLRPPNAHLGALHAPGPETPSPVAKTLGAVFNCLWQYREPVDTEDLMFRDGETPLDYGFRLLGLFAAENGELAPEILTAVNDRVRALLIRQAAAAAAGDGGAAFSCNNCGVANVPGPPRTGPGPPDASDLAALAAAATSASSSSAAAAAAFADAARRASSGGPGGACTGACAAPGLAATGPGPIATGPGPVAAGPGPAVLESGPSLATLSSGQTRTGSGDAGANSSEFAGPAAASPSRKERGAGRRRHSLSGTVPHAQGGGHAGAGPLAAAPDDARQVLRKRNKHSGGASKRSRAGSRHPFESLKGAFSSDQHIKTMILELSRNIRRRERRLKQEGAALKKPETDPANYTNHQDNCFARKGTAAPVKFPSMPSDQVVTLGAAPAGPEESVATNSDESFSSSGSSSGSNAATDSSDSEESRDQATGDGGVEERAKAVEKMLLQSRSKRRSTNGQANRRSRSSASGSSAPSSDAEVDFGPACAEDTDSEPVSMQATSGAAALRASQAALEALEAVPTSFSGGGSGDGGPIRASRAAVGPSQQGQGRRRRTLAGPPTAAVPPAYATPTAGSGEPAAIFRRSTGPGPVLEGTRSSGCDPPPDGAATGGVKPGCDGGGEGPSPQFRGGGVPGSTSTAASSAAVAAGPAESPLSALTAELIASSSAGGGGGLAPGGPGPAGVGPGPGGAGAGRATAAVQWTLAGEAKPSLSEIFLNVCDTVFVGGAPPHEGGGNAAFPRDVCQAAAAAAAAAAGAVAGAGAGGAPSEGTATTTAAAEAPH